MTPLTPEQRKRLIALIVEDERSAIDGGMDYKDFVNNHVGDYEEGRKAWKPLARYSDRGLRQEIFYRGRVQRDWVLEELGEKEATEMGLGRAWRQNKREGEQAITEFGP